MAVSNMLSAIASIFDTPEYADRIPANVRTAIANGNFGQEEISQPVMNAVLDGLIDKIARQDIYSFEYNNFDATQYVKGYLPFGGVIEDDFIEAMEADNVDMLPTATQAASGGYGIAQFDPFKIKYPSVKPSYYMLKPFMCYHTTTTEDMFKRAFTSESNAVNFVQRCRGVLPESAKLDKYLLFREMLATQDIYGENSIVPVTVAGDNFTAAESIAAVTKIRDYVNACSWVSDKYNQLGVLTSTPKDQMVLFISSGVYNAMSTAQYNAYHKDLDFGCEVQVIDGFGSSATTTGQFAVLCDKRALKLYYWMNDRFENIYNPASVGYWNTFYKFGMLMGYALHANIVQFQLTDGAD